MIQIVLGLLERDGQILLVGYHTAPGQPEQWTTPGGLVEPGEDLVSALVREVQEEAGLAVAAVSHLAYAVQIQRPTELVTAWAFVVGAWHGDGVINDPDGDISHAEFTPIELALARTQAITWPSMRESLHSYLRGELAPGTLLLYREHADPSDQTCIQRLPAQPSPA